MEDLKKEFEENKELILKSLDDIDDLKLDISLIFSDIQKDLEEKSKGSSQFYELLGEVYLLEKYFYNLRSEYEKVHRLKIEGEIIQRKIFEKEKEKCEHVCPIIL